jgi:uncharacterized Zn-binding protein involved in type VI secretion
MASALRVGDQTTHGGVVAGPGTPTVLIGSMPAAVATDTHICSIPANTPHLQVSIFPMGSATVLFGNKPALRTSDTCLCGAAGVVGEPTVQIGG